MVKKIILLFLAVLLMSGISVAATVDLPQTGQTKCYGESGAERLCTGTLEDGDTQSGVPWPSPRFTDNGDGTITDTLTGLMWLKDANCMKTSYASSDTDDTSGDSKVRWQSALNFVKGINDGTYHLCAAGHNDWRLPNINELESIVKAAPASSRAWLNEFLHVQANYWSSTTKAADTSEAWISNIDGTSEEGINKWFSYYVWPVRGTTSGRAQIFQTGQTVCYQDYTATPCGGTGQDGEELAGVAWPSPRFIDNGNGTVTDNLTGLIWLKDADCLKSYYPNLTDYFDGAVSWQHAIDFIIGINNGAYPLCGAGSIDWRLPNIEELQSLIDYSNSSPAVSSPFTNVQIDYYPYWSSTTAAQTNAALTISFLDGAKSTKLKNDIHVWVWPVRGGPKAKIAVTPAFFDFGDVANGSTSSEHAFTISNTGSGSINISNISVSNSTNFLLNVNGGSNPCASTSKTLTAGSSCTVAISFVATAIQQFNATLDIASDDLIKPTLSASLVGTGLSCTYTLNPATGQSFPAAGGPGIINVTASSGGCNWSVSNSGTWINVASGNDYTGSGTVNYTVAQNTDPASRTGNMSVAGQTFTISQSAVSTSTYTLTVNKSGTGSGSISASGLSCSGNTCTGSYDDGSQVTITATPGDGSTFGGWSGCDTVNGNQCTVTMNSSKSVTATFTATEGGGIVLSSVDPYIFGYGVTLTLSGSGFGEKKGSVMFGNYKAKIITWHDTSITCSLSKKAGIYPVKVVVKKVGESNVLNCTLSSPVLTDISPSSGNPNATITIDGQYYGVKKPKVQFISSANKKKSAKVTAYSDTQLTIVVPKVNVGTYQVLIQNSAGSSDGYEFYVGTQPADTEAPSVPAGLTAIAVSPNQIDLSWNASSDNQSVAGYKVYKNGSYLKEVTGTSTSDTGLSASTQYCYTVSAHDAANNESAQSTQACATTQAGADTQAPSVPTGLSATATSSSEINISWSASSDNTAVTGYKVYKNGSYLKEVTGTSTSDTGLSVSTQYCYTVSAHDAANNESTQSTQACATTQAGDGGGDTEAPSVPTGVTAIAISSSQINLSWNPSSDDTAVTGYKVYKNGVYLKAVGTRGTTTSDTGLSPDTEYCYTVSAFNAASNESAQSAQSCATTQAAADTQAPSAPTGLTATATSSSAINLSWNASTDNVGVEAYKVYRGGVFIKEVTGSTSTSDTGLTASTNYCYRVSARDAANNESAQSTQACATTQATADTTPPSVPTGLSATAASSSQINLSWSASTDNVGVEAYKVYRGGVFIKEVTGSTSTSDTGLTTSTNYCYRVSARDAANNESAQSTQACATTQAGIATTGTIRIINNTHYDMYSVKIDNVEQLPYASFVRVGEHLDTTVTPGNHTYYVAFSVTGTIYSPGFYEESDVPIYVAAGNMVLQTINNPTMAQVLSNFSTSQEWGYGFYDCDSGSPLWALMHFYSDGTWDSNEHTTVPHSGTIKEISWPDRSASFTFQLCSSNVCSQTLTYSMNTGSFFYNNVLTTCIGDPTGTYIQCPFGSCD